MPRKERAVEKNWREARLQKEATWASRLLISTQQTGDSTPLVSSSRWLGTDSTTRIQVRKTLNLVRMEVYLRGERRAVKRLDLLPLETASSRWLKLMRASQPT